MGDIGPREQSLIDLLRRMDALERSLEEMDRRGQSNAIVLARIEERLINATNSEVRWVTRAEFDPIRDVVRGLVGLILFSVVGAVLFLVVRK